MITNPCQRDNDPWLPLSSFSECPSHRFLRHQECVPHPPWKAAVDFPVVVAAAAVGPVLPALIALDPDSPDSAGHPGSAVAVAAAVGLAAGSALTDPGRSDRGSTDADGARPVRASR